MRLVGDDSVESERVGKARAWAIAADVNADGRRHLASCKGRNPSETEGLHEDHVAKHDRRRASAQPREVLPRVLEIDVSRRQHCCKV